jgi:hypothetical protein
MTWIAIAGGAFGQAHRDLPPTESLLDFNRKLADQIGHIDWNQETKGIHRQLQRVWAQNGWDNEADQFALHVAEEVSAIPPWQVVERLNAVSRRAAERYGLNPRQTTQLHWSMLREVAGFLMRNAGTIQKHTQGFMESAIAGRPLTVEEVARISQESQPMLNDLHDMVDRVTKELGPTLDPGGKEALERDLESYNKRRKYLDEATARWARGQWEPSEWGLEARQPIERVPVSPQGPNRQPSVPLTTRPAGTVPTMEAVVRWQAHDPATWFAYVKEFSRRYAFDPGQVTSAKSIHDELLVRALNYQEMHEAELKSVLLAERAEHERFEPIRVLFLELQERLQAIPTTTQRAAVRKDR